MRGCVKNELVGDRCASKCEVEDEDNINDNVASTEKIEEVS